MKKVQELLEKKNNEVARISREDSVLHAAEKMNDMRIGSLVVTEGDKVIGIFTERDILRRVVAAQKDPAATVVGDVMTTPCAICHPDDTLEYCEAVITEKRIRHLPVVENGSLVGMVTPGDIMASKRHETEKQIEYLKDYMYGP